MSEVFQRAVEGRQQPDGRARTGGRRRLRPVRVMSVFGPVPVVADSVSAVAIRVSVMSLRVHFRVEIHQIAVPVVRVLVQAPDLWKSEISTDQLKSTSPNKKQMVEIVFERTKHIANEIQYIRTTTLYWFGRESKRVKSYT